jgi:hypothetical protein
VFRMAEVWIHPHRRIERVEGTRQKHPPRRMARGEIRFLTTAPDLLRKVTLR